MIFNFKPTKPRTLNPYLYSLYTFYDRFTWDLRISSWISRNRLHSLYGKHNGEKAVIVCNGPSLIQEDLSCLSNITTFGLNKINLLFDKSSFRPSFIVAVNRYVIEQNIDFYNETSIPLFIDSHSSDIVKLRKNVCFVHTSLQNKFAKDCSMSVYRGGTVTFVAIQLAFHLGFRKLALIGCDHNFSTQGPVNQLVTSGDKDLNHFDPNYFAGGVKWQLPNLPLSEYSYHMAKENFEIEGGTIFNSTIGGKLEVFPRISLQEFLSL